MTAEWRKHLDRHIEQVHPRLVEIRRHLHQHPELSGEEHQTTGYLVDLLNTAQLPVQTGPDGRGAIVDFGPKLATGRVALRADIDALPIHETRECAYRSTQPGLMHACGHDGHTATVLGAIMALQQMQDSGELPCPVSWRALFQPAEETLLGANELIDAGALDNVPAIFSMHMDPSRAVGTIGVRNGAFTANCDSLAITITGRGGHAARPHQTIDPIAATAQLISTLYAQVPRIIDSQDAVVLSFGQIAAGEAANVIPDHAVLLGTLRTLDPGVRQQSKATIERIAAAIADATGTTLDLGWGAGIGGVMNDPAQTDRIRRAGVEVVGAVAVHEIARPSMGSEDFAAYLDHIPGCMFRLGCASPAAGSAGLHTPTFDLDEQALAIGARILARAVIFWSLDSSG